jgi:hypothetical protein
VGERMSARPEHGLGSPEHGWCPVCEVAVPLQPLGAWRAHEGHGFHACPECVRAILHSAGFAERRRGSGEFEALADTKSVTETPQ